MKVLWRFKEVRPPIHKGTTAAERPSLKYRILCKSCELVVAFIAGKGVMDKLQRFARRVGLGFRPDEELPVDGIQ